MMGNAIYSNDVQRLAVSHEAKRSAVKGVFKAAFAIASRLATNHVSLAMFLLPNAEMLVESFVAMSWS